MNKRENKILQKLSEKIVQISTKICYIEAFSKKHSQDIEEIKQILIEGQGKIRTNREAIADIKIKQREAFRNLLIGAGVVATIVAVIISKLL